MKKYILPLLFASFGLTLASCTKSPAKPTPTPTKTLSSIALSGEYKTEYYVDEELDLTGLVVTAHYSDASSKAVTAYSTSGFDSSEVDDEVVVTVSYTESQVTKTADFTVSVSAHSQEVHDITLKVTVSGIDTYEEGHAYIWMNAPILGTATQWGSRILTQDTTNLNLWSITLEDVTLDEIYEYDLYYGTATTIDWDNGKFILESGEHTFLDTSEGVYEYTYAATFNVPVVSGSVVIDLYITASVEETASATPVTTLNEGVYLWAWNNATNGTVVFDRTADEKWHHQFTVDLVDGKADLKVTPLLSLASTTFDDNWEYQYGAWENEVWVTWTTSSSVQEGGVTEDCDVNYTAHFKGQPVPADNHYSFTIVMTPTWTDESVTSSDTVFIIAGDAKVVKENISGWGKALMTYDSVKAAWTYSCTDVDEYTGEGDGYEIRFYAYQPGTTLADFDWNNASSSYYLAVDSTYADAEKSYSPEWATQPIVPEVSYTVTITFKSTNAAVSTPGLKADTTHEWAGNDVAWVSNLTWVSDGEWSYTYTSGSAEFYFEIQVWSDSLGGNFHVGYDSSWHNFHLSCTDTTCAVTITLDAEATPTSGGLVAGTASDFSNCSLLNA